MTRRRAAISLGILVGLHHAEKISFRVFAIRKLSDTGNRRLRHHQFSPSALRLLDGRVDGLHADRVGRCLYIGILHKAAVDPGRPLRAGGHHPVPHRPCPLVEFPAEDFLIKLRGALWITRWYFKMDDTRHGSPPNLNERSFCRFLSLALPRRRRCCRSRSVLLRGVTHDHSNDTAGQDDLEIVAVLHVRNEESEYEATRHTEKNSQRDGIHLSSKKARSNASYESLDGGPDDNTRDLSTHRRSEPRRRPVNRAQQRSQQQTQQHFVHHVPPSRFVSLVSLTTNPQIPLNLSVHKKQNRCAHCQIRCNQQYKEPIPPVKTPGLVKNALPVGADREPVQVSRNIQRHFLNAGIALRRSRSRRLCANGRQRFIEAASTRRGSHFRLAGKQESQQRAERIDIAACVQMFYVPARLFRRHIPGRAHHRAVSCYHRNFRGIADNACWFWLFENRCFRIGIARTVRNFS